MSVLRDGTHYRACNLCEAICGLMITVRDGRVTDLRGDPDDPLSRGAICPKGTALIDLHADPDRLRTPHIRTQSGWQTRDWDEAFDLAVNGLREVIATHSPESVAFYVGNPTVHNSGTLLGWSSLLRAIGTTQRYSATSVDQLPHHVAAQAMLGHHFLLPIPDIDRTDFFFVLGANPIASNGSLMTAPGMRERLRALRARGGRLVVVDPRRTETAALADEHLFIKPGTDALLLLAMVRVILDERLADLGRLADHTDGLETLSLAVADFSPESVATRCGIHAERIIALARTFAGAKQAVAYGRMGLSTQAFGGLCQWLIIVLNSITGNLDEPGGAMFTEPAFDLVRMSRSRPPVRRSRVRGLLEFDGEFPVATLTDEILTPGPGQIRALITIAGNPVLSTPNG
ncbi:MAG: molybdopterin-dependent oxidoreductase, partial [Vulcanimicrobiaceae bacterium]